MKYKVGTVIEFKTPDRHGIGEIVEVNTGSNKKSYLVKLLGKSAGTGHKGNGKSKEKYKTNDYWFVRENGVISIANPEEIHITRKGNEVHAVLKSGGQVVDRAKAVCSPDDEFDFWIGSSLAFSRLIAHTCENTKADPEPPKKFVPHLEHAFYGENYGTIGEKTLMKDAFGKELFVGDVVMIILPEDPTRRLYDFVVKTESYEKKAFVMGIEVDCESTGEIKNEIVIKVKSYEQINNGDLYDDIKAVLKE